MSHNPDPKAVLGNDPLGHHEVTEHPVASAPSHAMASIIAEAMQVEHVVPVRGTPLHASGQDEADAVLSRGIESLPNKDEKSGEAILEELRKIWRNQKPNSGEGEKS